MTEIPAPPAATTAPAAAGAVPDPRLAKRAAVAGGVGTLIEYYDFSVYAFLAVTIAPLFFPNSDPAAAIMSTLAVFGSAYLMRPLGGLFFGRLGDRAGRRTALVVTVVSMGLCCGALGLLPTYAQAGLVAPVLLLVVRLAQGFSAGGEIGGAATYIAESAPQARRGFFGSFTPVGSTLGFAVAAAMVGVVNALTTDEQLATWGWRIPFLLSLPLAVVCLMARMRLEDTPEFAAMAARAEVIKSPVLQVVRHHPLAVLRVVGIAIAMNGSGYIGLAYIGTYLINDLGYDADQVYWMTAAMIAVACATMPLSGMLTDRFGRRPVLLTGYLAYVLLAYPLLAVMGSAGGMVWVALAYLVFMTLNGVVQVPAFPQFTELFPRRVRYTGVALGFNIGTIVAGGSAPYIAALLVQSTGNPMSVAYWVIGVALVGVVTVATLRETSRERLPV